MKADIKHIMRRGARISASLSSALLAKSVSKFLWFQNSVGFFNFNELCPSIKPFFVKIEHEFLEIFNVERRIGVKS